MKIIKKEKIEGTKILIGKFVSGKRGISKPMKSILLTGLDVAQVYNKILKILEKEEENQK